MKHILSLLISFAFMPSAGAGDAENGSAIGYPTVKVALDALKTNPDAKVAIQQGWTIIDIANGKKMTIWSFAPVDHPAYPAAVKREVIERDGSVHINMKVLCEAAKSECDALVGEFERLNENIRQKFGNGS